MGRRVVGVVRVAPLFGYMRLMHELARSLTDDRSESEVASGIWVGRRPRAHELPPGTTIVVDLCAELAESPASRLVGATSRSHARCHVTDPGGIVRAVDAVLAPPALRSSTARSATAARPRWPPPCSCAVARPRSPTSSARCARSAPRIGLNAHQIRALAESVRLGAAAPQPSPE